MTAVPKNLTNGLALMTFGRDLLLLSSDDDFSTKSVVEDIDDDDVVDVDVVGTVKAVTCDTVATASATAILDIFIITVCCFDWLSTKGTNIFLGSDFNAEGLY
jgi:hypothetical protein